MCVKGLGICADEDNVLKEKVSKQFEGVCSKEQVYLRVITD